MKSFSSIENWTLVQLLARFFKVVKKIVDSLADEQSTSKYEIVGVPQAYACAAEEAA